MQPQLIEPPKPPIINAVGLTIIILAGVVITNCIAFILILLFIYKVTSIVEPQQQEEIAEIRAALRFIVPAALVMIAFSFIFLIGGIYLRQYRPWARHLLTLASAALLVATWLLVGAVLRERDVPLEGFNLIFTATLWSVPLALLIRFLNRERTRRHFKKEDSPAI